MGLFEQERVKRQAREAERLALVSRQQRRQRERAEAAEAAEAARRAQWEVPTEPAAYAEYVGKLRGLEEFAAESRTIDRLNAADAAKLEEGLAGGRVQARHVNRLLDAVRPISRKAVRECGRVTITKQYDGGVPVNVNHKGNASFGGIATCGNTHGCPVCGTQKRAERQAELLALQRFVAKEWPASARLALSECGELDAEAEPRYLPWLAADPEHRIRPATDAERAWYPVTRSACGHGWERAEGSLSLRPHRFHRLHHQRESTNVGASMGMLTLTCPHQRGDDLGELVGALRRASASVRKSALWKGLKRYHDVMYVQYIDVTYGWANGWHPHLHIMLVFKRGTVLTEHLQAALAEEWHRQMLAEMPELYERREGDGEATQYDECGVKLAHASACKLDVSPAADGAAFAAYVGKLGLEMTDAAGGKKSAAGHYTPSMIAERYAGILDALDAVERERETPGRERRIAKLERSLSHYGKLWQEYVHGMHRVHLHSGPEAIALARAARRGELFAEAERVYDERSGEAPASELVAVIPKEDWHVLRYLPGARVKMLEAVTRDGFTGLLTYIRGHRAVYMKPRLTKQRVRLNNPDGTPSDDWEVRVVQTEGFWWYPILAEQRIREATAKDWGPAEYVPPNPADFIDD